MDIPRLAEPLAAVLREPDPAQIESVCAAVLAALRAEGLTDAPGEDLERHAYAVNDTIADTELRNLHILAGV